MRRIVAVSRLGSFAIFYYFWKGRAAFDTGKDGVARTLTEGEHRNFSALIVQKVRQ